MIQFQKSSYLIELLNQPERSDKILCLFNTHDAIVQLTYNINFGKLQLYFVHPNVIKVKNYVVNSKY